MSGPAARVDQSMLTGLLSAKTPDDVYDRVVDACLDRLDADRCVISLDTDGGLEPVAVSDDGATVEDLRDRPGWDYQSLAVRDGDSYLVGDLADDGSTTRRPTGDGRRSPSDATRSVLSVPIDGVGVVFATAADPMAFTESDREWLEAVALYVGSSLTRFRSPEPVYSAVTSSGSTTRCEPTEADAEAPVALEDLDERLSFVLDATDSVLWTVNVSARTLRLFGPVERIVGLDRDTEYPLSEFVDGFVHPDDRERLVEQIQAVTIGQRDSVELEYRLEPADSDESRWFRNRSGLLEDERTTLIGLSTDVSEHVSREQRIKRLQQRTTRLIGAQSQSQIANVAVNAAEDALTLPLAGIHIRDGDVLEPTAVNERVWEVIGEVPSYRAHDDDPIDTFVWETYGRGRPAVVEDTAEHDQLSEATNVRSVIIYPLDDYGVFVASAREPDAFDSVDVALGEVLSMGIVAALERTEQEDRLREQARELERKNERLEEFTSIVSHDLRNPLNVALGRVEYVRNDRDDDHLATAQQALERMAAIIEETLALARQGHSVSDREPVSVPEIAHRCWQTVQTASATLETAFEGAFTVLADRERLAHVLENLITNAVEHGGENVTVRIGPLTDEPGFYVEDDGPGIPETERSDVFETGYTTAQDGTGFGLSLVRDIVTAHGWTITATTGSNGGARFEITDVERS
ncbi:GAF domain-containing sensor histidine kinase [Halomicrobium katesii]|uniref:GAF domain-containing sensor histidine kinase n=1 Tax=Halomicrobium katesii TaxID=437163 RepID=UPI000361B0B8|nr:ATP-binding protein [Halomicrobium katesii]